MKLDELLILSEIINHKQVKVADLAMSPNISSYRLQAILDKLHSMEFIEPTGKTSGRAYILHISKRSSMGIRRNRRKLGRKKPYCVIWTPLVR